VRNSTQHAKNPPPAPPSAPADAPDATPQRAPRKKPSFLSKVLHLLVVFVFLAVLARMVLPSWLQAYVNRTIDKHPLYDGVIGDVDLQLLKGGYTIRDIRLNKTTGNVPVPFFAARRVDLHIEWDALVAGKVVGKIVMREPQLNFVDAPDPANSQTGSSQAASTPVNTDAKAVTAGQSGGGPWLDMIRDLFPFRINSVLIQDGDIHFRAFNTAPPVDVYLDRVEGSITNLTNIHDEVTPLITRSHATALAMGQAPCEFDMKLDPFSYRPTFQLAIRLIGLDVTQTNALAKAYGKFDFERGFFDLVVELDAKEGRLEGYVKPLFRHLTVLSLEKDIRENNVLELFWEALVGVGAEVLQNQPRDQVGTYVPLSGDLARPDTDVLTVVGNVLRNAFIRAYLPRFERVAPDIDWLEFGQATSIDGAPVDPGPIRDRATRNPKVQLRK
jgi:hypothetical protein